jgi:hypothetical protein
MAHDLIDDLAIALKLVELARWRRIEKSQLWHSRKDWLGFEAETSTAASFRKLHSLLRRNGLVLSSWLPLINGTEIEYQKPIGGTGLIIRIIYAPLGDEPPINRLIYVLPGEGRSWRRYGRQALSSPDHEHPAYVEALRRYGLGDVKFVPSPPPQ